MMQIKRFTPVLLLGLLLVLVACGGDGDEGEAVTSGDPATALELSESLTTTDQVNGVLTVEYPAEWYAQENFGQITIADSEATAQEGGTPSDGQFWVRVLPIATEQLGDIGVDASTTVVEIINLVSGIAFEGEDSGQLGEIETVTLNDREAALATGTVNNDGETGDTAFVAVNEGDSFVVFSVTAAEGEINNYLATMQAMAGVVVYEPPLVPTPQG